MQLAVLAVPHLRPRAVEARHRNILRFIDGGQALGLARIHQVVREFGLAVRGDDLAAGEAVHVDGVSLAVEGQLDRVVDDAFAVQPRADAGFVHEVDRHLLEDARADATQNVVGALALHDHVVYAGLVQQLAQQQARRARADDGHLRACLHVHALSPCPAA